MNLSPDLLDLLQAFDDAEVEYLLVGGLAVAIHGRPRFTKDADLWVRDSAENLGRASRALEAFGAPAGTGDHLRWAAPEDVVWMGHPPSRIDLVKWVPGGDFDAAWSTRTTLRVDGVSVQVVGARALIALKIASGRAQDLEDARVLRAALDCADP